MLCAWDITCISGAWLIILCTWHIISCAQHNLYINTCQYQELRLKMEVIYQINLFVLPLMLQVVWCINMVYQFWNTTIEYGIMIKTLFDFNMFFSQDEIHLVIHVCKTSKKSFCWNVRGLLCPFLIQIQNKSLQRYMPISA